MSKFKMYAGVLMFMQAVMLLIVMLAFLANKKKRTAILAALAVGSGVAGAYLLLKGADEYEPKVECNDGDNVDFLADEEPIDELHELDCVISDEVI